MAKTIKQKADELRKKYSTSAYTPASQDEIRAAQQEYDRHNEAQGLVDNWVSWVNSRNSTIDRIVGSTTPKQHANLVRTYNERGQKLRNYAQQRSDLWEGYNIGAQDFEDSYREALIPLIPMEQSAFPNAAQGELSTTAEAAKRSLAIQSGMTPGSRNLAADPVAEAKSYLDEVRQTGYAPANVGVNRGAYSTQSPLSQAEQAYEDALAAYLADENDMGSLLKEREEYDRIARGIGSASPTDANARSDAETALRLYDERINALRKEEKYRETARNSMLNSIDPEGIPEMAARLNGETIVNDITEAMPDAKRAREIAYEEWGNAAETALATLTPEELEMVMTRPVTEIENAKHRNERSGYISYEAWDLLKERFGANAQDVYLYIKRLHDEEDATVLEKGLESLTNTNAGAAIGSVASVPLSLIGGVVGAADLAAQSVRAITGRPVNWDSPMQQLAAVSANIREDVGDDIQYGRDGTKRSAFRDVMSFGYGVATSVADSWASMLAGPYGVLILGGAAGTQAAQAAKDNGSTDREALVTGLTAGAAEAVMELIGIDNLLKVVKGDIALETYEAIAKNVGKQAMAEGFEELGTTIVNTIMNVIIRGDENDIALRAEELHRGGMKMEDAQRKAAWEWVGGALTDTLAGIASGGFSGFVAGTTNKASRDYAENKAATNLYSGRDAEYEKVLQKYLGEGKTKEEAAKLANKEVKQTFTREYTRQRVNDSAEAYVTEALELTPDSELAQGIKGKLDSGKNVSARDVHKLAQQNEQAIFNNDIKTIANAAEQQLTKLGETGDVKTVATAVAKRVAGETLTNAEAAAMSASTNAKSVLSDLSVRNINKEGYNAEWTGVINTDRINVAEYSRALKNAELPQGDSNAKQDAEAGQKTTAVKTATVASKKAVSIENTAPDNAVATSATVDSVAKGFGEESGTFKSTYNADQSLEDYTVGFRNAYNRARAGLSLDYAVEQRGTLDEAQVKAAYNAGMRSMSRWAATMSQGIEGSLPKISSTRKGVVRGENGLTGDALQKAYGMNNDQVRAYNILANIAKVTGIDIVLYRSEVKDGKYVGANGEFRRLEPNTIYLDVNAGLTRVGDEVRGAAGLSNYTMLRTFSHEFVHWMEYWDPEGYLELRKTVFAEIDRREADGQSKFTAEGLIVDKANRLGLTYEDASHEVLADALTDILPDSHFMEVLAQENPSLMDRIITALKEFIESIKSHFAELTTATTAEREALTGGMNYAQNLVDAYDKAAANAVRRLQAAKAKKAEQAQAVKAVEKEAKIAEAKTDADIDVSTEAVPVEDVVRGSYRSLAEAAGFTAEEYADGNRFFVRDGAFVKEVTVEDIENSPIGALINYSLEQGDISKADADRQKKMFAEVCTMACKTNDFSMTMQFMGSAVFTGMKANADKQYGTTYDFPSICTKTQAVIDAMSARMVKLGRGLSTDEIVALYRKVWASGNPVPCSECYVFSRWIGIGGLLDNIKKYQDYYGNMTVEEAASAYREMYATISEYAKEQGLTYGKAKGALSSKLTKEYNKLAEKIEKAENQGETVKAADRKRLEELEPQMNTVKAMTWLENVYFADSSLKKVNPNFRVPNEVLFDLNNGEAFVTQYPEAWAFRTTQGAGYGKAITPYAEARLGEGILVTNNTTTAIKGKAAGTLDNFFLKQNGKLDAKARKALATARAKQKNQAFIGGQRFQSTSDARYENASDYLIAALEMQAMNGMVQAYTKVDGAVPAFSAWGFSINQSLMPLNGGLNADGSVADTSKGGMNPAIAFANRRKHESAGTITIGVNDNHIRAMFKQNVRDFIIPYHASGGKAEVVAAFRAIQDGQEQKGEMVHSTDYSRTQSDKVLSDDVLRWQGKTEAQIQRIHEIREARIAILSGGKKNKPDMTVVRSNRFLSALYDKLNGGEWDGVQIAKGKIESQIFPNEFWDQTVSYKDSGQITRDYLEYCNDLGFLHRFSGTVPSNGRLVPVSGYDENGKRVQLTDLAYKYDENGQKTDQVEDFFWKVLTDRRMYDNAGKYLPQKIVALNDTTTDTVTSFAKQNYGRQYNKTLSLETADRLAGEDIVRYQGRDVLSCDIAWDPNNHSSIKSQMVKHMDEINEMNPVSSIVFEKNNDKTYADILDETLRSKFGYKIERPDGASFLFDKVAIGDLRGYVKSDEEAAAVISAPYVLKRGKAISGHKNHKDNGYPSVTYAGPVIINGERVNVAVVVLFGDKYRPHALRVLMPSGNEYTISKTKTDPKMKEASPKGAVRSSTGSVPEKIVTQPKKTVKHSMRKDVVRRSSRDDYAPTFYSQMGKVVDALKPGKYGAASVVNTLRGKGVKAEEIKWSGIEQWLDGKKSVSKEELQEFVAGSMLQVEEEFKTDEPKWDAYRLRGGSNYRELLFKLPDSDYSNDAMKAHWGYETSGVLAHARLQDFNVDGGKMLFVEEIQSDWHNEGHKKGYSDKPDMVSEANTTVKLEDGVYYLYYGDTRTDASVRKAFAERSRPGWGIDEIHAGLVDMYNDRHMGERKVPEAPFSETYHEFVMKRLIREAAENGYASIGWTTADIQSDRWSDEYAEGYRIEYDQNIPKFLRKYGKQWGAKLGRTTLPETGDGMFVSDQGDRYRSYNDALNELIDDANAILRGNITIHDVTTTVDGNVTTVYDDLGVILGTITKKNTDTEVWSMPITDEMRDSVLYEGQVMYQDRPATLSDREVLERAAEVLATKDAIAQSVLAHRDDQSACALYHAMKDSLNDSERHALGIMQKRLEIMKDYQAELEALHSAREQQLEEFKRLRDLHNARLEEMGLAEERKRLGKLYRDQQYGNNPDREAAKATLARMREIDEKTGREEMNQAKKLLDKTNNAISIRNQQIERASEAVVDAESKSLLKKVLIKARKVIEAQDNEKMRYEMDVLVDRMNNAAAVKRYKAHIKSDVADLTDWLTNPDLKNARARVPEVLKNPVGEFIKSIDFTSKRQLRGGEATKADKEFMLRLEAVQQAFTDEIDLHGKYSGYLDLPEWFMEEMQSYITAINKVVNTTREGFVINNMTADQLKTLSELVRVFKKSIQRVNAFHNNGMFQSVSDAGDNSITYMQGFKKEEAQTGMLSNYLKWQQIRPAYAFERFGKGGISIYKGLRDGQAKLAFNVQEVVAFAQKTYTEAELKAWEKEIHTFKLGDDNVKVPASYLMGLYELYKQEDSRRHLLGEGLRVATYDHKGKQIRDRGHKLTEEDIEKMLGELTTRQKTVADALQKHMASKGAEWGNYVSFARFGIDQFTNPQYYPINSDGRHLPKDSTEEKPNAASLYALLNMSFTKQRNELANNRIVLYSIFDVYANHMASMAQYNAMALPILDAVKWLNYKDVKFKKLTQKPADWDTNWKDYFKGDALEHSKLGGQKAPKWEEGKYMERIVGDSVRNQMSLAYGTPTEKRPGSGKTSYAESFVANIIKSFNGTEAQGDPKENVLMKMLSNYNVSQVAYKLSVVVKQPLAISRAGLELNADHIIKGLRLKPEQIKANIREMQKYSGIAVWKKLGFYDVNVTSNVVSLIKHDSDFKQTVQDIGLWGAEQADQLTWAAIWSGCKDYVIAHQHIKPTDEGFFKAVSEKFDDVVYNTQVVDSTLTKSEFMRSKSFGARLFTSFQSESVASISPLVDAYERFHLDMRRGNTMSQAWRKNGKYIGKATAIYVISVLLEGVVDSALDAYKDDDEYEKPLLNFAKSLPMNILKAANPLSKVPIISDIMEAAIALVKPWAKEFLNVDLPGGYAPELPIAAVINYLTSASEIIIGLIDGEEYGYTWYAALSKMLQAASSLTGYPAGAAVGEIATAFNNTIGKMAPSIKIPPTYRSTPKSAIGYAYKDGHLSQEEATAELIARGVAKDADEAYFILRGYEDENYKKFGALEAAILEGKDTSVAMQELLDHGYTDKDLAIHIKSKIGEWYKGTDKEPQKINKQQALSMLKQYVGLNDKEATALVTEWSSKVVTGIDYNDIGDAYVSGEIKERSRAVEMLMMYGGLSKEEADKKVLSWDAEKDTGVAYSDMKQAFLDGDITAKQAVEMRITYGGYERDSAEATVRGWQAEKDTGVAYDDVKQAFVDEDITYDQAVSMRVAYGGYESEDAEKTVLEWQAERDTGIAYDDIGKAYTDGEITRKEAVSMWQKYGGQSEEDADEKATVAEFKAQYGDEVDWEASTILTYRKEAEPAGIDVGTYDAYLDKVRNCKGTDKNGDGKTDNGSKKAEILRVIDSLPISNAQKDALYRANGWSERTMYEAPWR